MVFRCFGVFNQRDVAPVTDGAQTIWIDFTFVNQVMTYGVSALSRKPHTRDSAMLSAFFTDFITMNTYLNAKCRLGV